MASNFVKSLNATFLMSSKVVYLWVTWSNRILNRASRWSTKGCSLRSSSAQASSFTTPFKVMNSKFFYRQGTWICRWIPFLWKVHQRYRFTQPLQITVKSRLPAREDRVMPTSKQTRAAFILVRGLNWRIVLSWCLKLISKVLKFRYSKRFKPLTFCRNHKRTLVR